MKTLLTNVDLYYIYIRIRNRYKISGTRKKYRIRRLSVLCKLTWLGTRGSGLGTRDLVIMSRSISCILNMTFSDSFSCIFLMLVKIHRINWNSHFLSKRRNFWVELTTGYQQRRSLQKLFREGGGGCIYLMGPSLKCH